MKQSNQAMKSVDEMFRGELDRLGIPYEYTVDELYQLQLDGQLLQVSLDNLRRNFLRDQDPQSILKFVAAINSKALVGTPTWQEVLPKLRYSLEPADYVEGFDGFLGKKVTDTLNQVFVYVDDDLGMSWVNHSHLISWNVSAKDVVEAAEANMTQVMGEAKCEILTNGNYRVGALATRESSFKASLILSKAFRELVAPHFGWPVNVVVPCRDFVYVIAKEDCEMLSRLGRVVVEEYRNSGYPITKEVLEVSDGGIRAIGTYPEGT